MELELTFLDHFFSKILLEKECCYTEDTARSIARLIYFARQGDLCSSVKELGDPILSLPPSILSESSLSSPLVRDGDRIYLQKNWVYETTVLNHIQRLRGMPAPSFFDRSIFENQLKEIPLLSQQTGALQSALDSCLTLICGGPGTGKTYTASRLVGLLAACLNQEEKKKLRICLSAPTGKAAAHFQSILSSKESLNPVIEIETATLHRLLKLQPGENRLFFQRPIDADVVIIDEASMIDTSLLAHLLEAISDQTLLIFMGDPNQLPPVDSGSLFGEIASYCGVYLEKSLRVEGEISPLFARAVTQGRPEDMLSLLKSGNPNLVPLSWGLDSSLPLKLYHEINPVVSQERPDPKESFEKYQRFRILNPLRKGSFGVDQLNGRIFDIIEQKKQKDQWWAIPILVTVNDSRSQLYNGTNGVLIGQNLKNAIAYFPDDSGSMRSFSFPPAYEMAFCLSIHKSQGSEFEQVLALFPEGSENFGREALYTAVTRSKKKLQILGKEEILQKMAAMHSVKKSGFLERVKDKIT